MSQQLTLTLSDEAYQKIRQQASQAGLSLSAWALSKITGEGEQLTASRLSKAQREEALESLMSHVGSMDLGYAIGTDNEDIDADLAKEYANGL